MTQINQDRALVVGPYYLLEEEEEDTPRTLLGVMDGHAARGEIVSEFVVTELPKLLAQRLNKGNWHGRFPRWSPDLPTIPRKIVPE